MIVHGADHEPDLCSDTCRVGLIGLGIMGKSMSKNLVKAGYHLTVFNTSPPPIEELAAPGAGKARSSKEVAERSDVIITMLPDGPDVEKAVLGPAGVLEGMKNGSTWVDMSSISPVVARKVAAEVEKNGGRALDVPVSGGETGAIEGTLAVMFGRSREVLEECLPILKVIGKSVTLVGGTGTGRVTKLANQIIVAINIEALAEALVFATKAGVDPVVLVGAIREGLAGSRVMETKAKMIVDRNFRPGFQD